MERMRNDWLSGADWRTSFADEILIVLKFMIFSGELFESYRSREFTEVDFYSWLTNLACRGFERDWLADVNAWL